MLFPLPLFFFLSLSPLHLLLFFRSPPIALLLCAVVRLNDQPFTSSAQLNSTQLIEQTQHSKMKSALYSSLMKVILLRGSSMDLSSHPILSWTCCCYTVYETHTLRSLSDTISSSPYINQFCSLSLALTKHSCIFFFFLFVLVMLYNIPLSLYFSTCIVLMFAVHPASCPVVSTSALFHIFRCCCRAASSL